MGGAVMGEETRIAAKGPGDIHLHIIRTAARTAPSPAGAVERRARHRAVGAEANLLPIAPATGSTPKQELFRCRGYQVGVGEIVYHIGVEVDLVNDAPHSPIRG